MRPKTAVQSKVNYALVGFFVLLLSAALLGVAFWLTLGGKTKVHDRYVVYFNESVAGLNLKATVRYRGVQVGQVESIQLDPANPDRVEVVLGIERGTPIRRDTIATLSTQGLTGVASVELSGGGGEVPPLEKAPGQELPVIQAGPSLVARLDDAFSNILTNVNKLSSRLERLLGDDNQTAITSILQDASKMTKTLSARSDSLRNIMGNVETLTGDLTKHSRSFHAIMGNIETFTGDLSKHSQQLGKALDELTKSLEGTKPLSVQAQTTLRDFSTAAQAVRTTADTFTQTSRDLSKMADVGQQELRRLRQGAEPELNMLLIQAGDLVTALQRLAELLEQNPRALILGKPSGRPGPGEK